MKKPKKKKPKTPQQLKETMRKRAVAMAKEINKILAGYLCEYCHTGKPFKRVESHHIFNEGHHISMSADPDNMICLCSLHHGNGRFVARSGTFGFHRTPAEAMEWFKEKHPERYQSLKERTWKSETCTIEYWKEKIVELSEIIKNINKT